MKHLGDKASTMCSKARTFLVVAVMGIFLTKALQSGPTKKQDYDDARLKEVNSEVMRRFPMREKKQKYS